MLDSSLTTVEETKDYCEVRRLLLKDINTELLDRLSLRVKRGDFQGKCKVC